MAKSRKKRTKKYSGVYASTNRPSITRVQAVSRSKTGQWLHEKRKLIKTVGIIALVVAIIILVISGIVSLF